MVTNELYHGAAYTIWSLFVGVLLLLVLAYRYRHTIPICGSWQIILTIVHGIQKTLKRVESITNRAGVRSGRAFVAVTLGTHILIGYCLAMYNWISPQLAILAAIIATGIAVLLLAPSE